MFQNSDVRNAVGPRSEEVTKIGVKYIMRGFTHY
jgi:hypothetical protein